MRCSRGNEREALTCKHDIAVVVVGDDTYYWVYLSSDHPFQVCCKVRQPFCYKVKQVLLESATEHLSTYLG